jgi:hypothetical protein
MLIQNYGLFWRRDEVHWGKQKNNGHLKGKHAKRARPVNFRDQQGVYVLYDENYRIVYVGQAGGKNNQRLLGRLRQHRSDQLAGRWTKFSWFGVQGVDHRSYTLNGEPPAAPSVADVLNHIEAILIVAGEPPLNRQGGKFGSKVEQYFQFRDPDALGPPQEQMLRDLWKVRKKEKKTA